MNIYTRKIDAIIKAMMNHETYLGGYKVGVKLTKEYFPHITLPTKDPDSERVSSNYARLKEFLLNLPHNEEFLDIHTQVRTKD